MPVTRISSATGWVTGHGPTSLPWKYDEEFADQKVRNWTASITDEVAGQVKSYKHFTYLRVFNGGHMVPFDVPENSLSMVNEWIHGDFSL